MIELIFEGVSYTNWTEYTVDVDLRRSASSFSLKVRPPATGVPITPGGLAEITIDGNTILWGRVDIVSMRTNAGGSQVGIHGRDAGGLLVDAACLPSWRWTNGTLSDIASTVANYVGMIRTPNVEYSPTVRSLKAEPGERCWALLERVARAEGLRMWVAANGQLQISQYISSSPTSAGRLVLNRRGEEVNVIDADVRRSCIDSYSEITVLGQWDDGRSTKSQMAQELDLAAPYFKPDVLVADVRGAAEAKAHALEAATRGAGRRLELEYTVRGHVDASGVPWTVNTLVEVEDEVNQVTGQHIVIATRFSRGPDGTKTMLTLADPAVFRG